MVCSNLLLGLDPELQILHTTYWMWPKLLDNFVFINSYKSVVSTTSLIRCSGRSIVFVPHDSNEKKKNCPIVSAKIIILTDNR